MSCLHSWWECNCYDMSTGTLTGDLQVVIVVPKELLMGSSIRHLADTLVEAAWAESELWGEIEPDAGGRPPEGRDIEEAKLNLVAALQSVYDDWLEGENSGDTE